MKRREFIRLLGGAAAGAPLAARAQQGAGMPRIGVLLANAKEHPLTAPSVAAFTKALQELGWVEGQNVRIDYRWAASDLERMQVFAKELVSLQPSVVVGQSTPVVVALKRETKTIPIVFISIAEPVKSGLVASLSHPGGNITGFSNFEPSLAGKWIEILKDIVPRMTRTANMFYPDTSGYGFSQQPLEIAARSHAIELVAAPARNEADIERIIAGLADDPTVGLIVAGDPFFGAQHNLDLVTSRATRYRVPTIFALPIVRRRRRPDLVWERPARSVSASANLYRSHPQGRQSGRPSGPNAHQVRAGDQPQDGESDGSRNTVHIDRPRRRGDRMKRREFIEIIE